jgi:hypothetical protein
MNLFTAVRQLNIGLKRRSYEQVIRKLFTEEGKYCSRIVLFKFC